MLFFSQIREGGAGVSSLTKVGLNDTYGIGEALARITRQSALGALGCCLPQELGDGGFFERCRPSHALIQIWIESEASHGGNVSRCS